MLSLPCSVRIFAAREAVGFRKGLDGLTAIVREGFGEDPFSGHYFLLFDRRRDRAKLLVWNRNGLWLFYKRLGRGTFAAIAEARTPRTGRRAPSRPSSPRKRVSPRRSAGK